MAYLRALAALSIVAIFLLAANLVRFVCGVRLRSGLALGFCRALAFLLGLRVRVRGSPAGGPAIIVANHVSWSDIIVLGSQRPLAFLAKREVRSWPALGRLAQIQGCVFVDRRRRMALPAANRRIAALLREGRSIVLFAEGTTGDGTIVRKFLSSHLEAARVAATPVVIQPVSLAYRARSGLPLGRTGRASLAWLGDMTFWPSFMEVLRGGAVDCEIGYAPPFELGGELDRKAAARRAEREVRDLLKRSLCNELPARDEETGTDPPDPIHIAPTRPLPQGL